MVHVEINFRIKGLIPVNENGVNNYLEDDWNLIFI